MGNYEVMRKMLQDEFLSIDISNYFSDMDGMHLWHIEAKLIKEWDMEDPDSDSKAVSELLEGLIIPNETIFDRDLNYINYYSCLELCDSISDNLYTVYETLFDGYRLKDDVLLKLGLSKNDAASSDILYFETVKYCHSDDLKKLINCMDIIKEGSAAYLCKIAVVLLNAIEEKDIVDIFLDCGWNIEVNGEVVVVYDNI